MALYIELAVFWNAEIYHGGVQIRNVRAVRSTIIESRYLFYDYSVSNLSKWHIKVIKNRAI